MLHTVSNSLIKIQLQKFFKMPGKCECGCNERVAFKGMFKKGHQPEGTSRDPEGKQKLLNGKWNPIKNPINNPKWNPITNAKWNPINNPKWNPITNAKWNPIISAKLKKARLEKDMEYIRKNPECGIVETDEELDNLIDSKMNSKCIEEYPDSTLSQLIEKKEIIIYIGLT